MTVLSILFFTFFSVFICFPPSWDPFLLFYISFLCVSRKHIVLHRHPPQAIVNQAVPSAFHALLRPRQGLSCGCRTTIFAATEVSAIVIVIVKLPNDPRRKIIMQANLLCGSHVWNWVRSHLQGFLSSSDRIPELLSRLSAFFCSLHSFFSVSLSTSFFVLTGPPFSVVCDDFPSFGPLS